MTQMNTMQNISLRVARRPRVAHLRGVLAEESRGTARGRETMDGANQGSRRVGRRSELTNLGRRARGTAEGAHRPGMAGAWDGAARFGAWGRGRADRGCKGSDEWGTGGLAGRVKR
jgi:hypothetical protein